MEHVVSTTDTIINIAIQVANIALFFFLFIKFAGKTLTDAISEKIEKEKKLADADNKYVSLIAEANAKKEQILADALSHKKSLIIEAESLAKQKREELLAKTNIEIQLLIEKAQKDAQIQKQDMEKGFEQGVKNTALMMLKKLFSTNKQASDMYVSGLVEEFNASYKS